MKSGDLVRFWTYDPTVALADANQSDGDMWVPPGIWRIGLLVEYHTWEKVGTVLFEGKIHRIRAEHIQKAGKKDWVPV